MKKKIIIVTLVLLLLFILGVLLQPKEYEIVKSIKIKNPRSEVFQSVIDMSTWPSWSPWIKEDPLAKLEISKPSTGRGASHRWSSEKLGSGDIEVTDSIPDEFIKIKLNIYNSRSAKTYAYFKLKKESEGVTEVFWRVETKNLNFLDKFWYLISSFQSKIDKDLELGLKNLKELNQKPKQ